MDVVLGVAVTGPVARLALLDGSASDEHDLIDQSTIDVAADPAQKLATAIVGTHRLLADDDHRLSAMRVCWQDERRVEQLNRALAKAGLPPITAVSEPEAALALVRNSVHPVGNRSSGHAANGAIKGHGDSALLFLDDETATLSIVGADDVTTTVVAAEPVAGSDPTSACNTLLDRLSEEPGAAENIYLISTCADVSSVAKRIRANSPRPLVIPEEPDLALARGAALAAGFTARTDGTMAADAVAPESDSYPMAATPGSHAGPQLAYSMVDDSGPLSIEMAGANNDSAVPLQKPMAPLSRADADDEEDAAPDAPAARPRFLLLGSSIAAIVVVAFAALAVTVAIGIRPTAVQKTPQQQEPVQNKYFPQLPNVATPPQGGQESGPSPQGVPVPPQPPNAIPAGGAPAGPGPGPAAQVPAGPPAEAPPPPPVAVPPVDPPNGLPAPPNVPNIQLPPIIINVPPQGPGGHQPPGGQPPGVQPPGVQPPGVQPPGVQPPPVVKQPPDVLPPPVVKQPPDVLPPPVVKQPPDVLPPPVVKQPPDVLPPPVVKQPPDVLPPPVVKQPPDVPPPLGKPVQPPVAPPPVVKQPPVVQPPPVVKQPPVIQPPVVQAPVHQPPLFPPRR